MFFDMLFLLASDSTLGQPDVLFCFGYSFYYRFDSSLEIIVVLFSFFRLGFWVDSPLWPTSSATYSETGSSFTKFGKLTRIFWLVGSLDEQVLNQSSGANWQYWTFLLRSARASSRATQHVFQPFRFELGLTLLTTGETTVSSSLIGDHSSQFLSR